MKNISLLVAILFLSPANLSSADERPSDIIHSAGETLAAALAKFSVNSGNIGEYRRFALGIDDTLNSYTANLTPEIAGLSFANGRAFCHTRAGGERDGAGFRQLRVVHEGRTGVKPPNYPGHSIGVNGQIDSRSRIQFAAYRISGNPAPVQIQISCEFSDLILDDPADSLSRKREETRRGPIRSGRDGSGHAATRGGARGVSCAWRGTSS